MRASHGPTLVFDRSDTSFGRKQEPPEAAELATSDSRGLSLSQSALRVAGHDRDEPSRDLFIRFNGLAATLLHPFGKHELQTLYEREDQ